jgi:hypothetical protein
MTFVSDVDAYSEEVDVEIVLAFFAMVLIFVFRFAVRFMVIF